MIKKSLDIPCIFDAEVEEVMRNIRNQVGPSGTGRFGRCSLSQVTSLIEGLTDQNMLQMSLGLAHTLNRRPTAISQSAPHFGQASHIGMGGYSHFFDAVQASFHEFAIQFVGLPCTGRADVGPSLLWPAVFLSQLQHLPDPSFFILRCLPKLASTPDLVASNGCFRLT